MAEIIEMARPQPSERGLAYHLLRYVPNLVRDEWVNIGVLVFNPQTGERRLRLIEDQGEYNRVRRLHPSADEAVLRALRNELEDRLDRGSAIPLENILRKCDETLSTTLQLAPQKGVMAGDLDAELERLMAITSPFPTLSPGLGNQEAAPRFAHTARRSSSRPGFGTGCKSPCAWPNLHFPAILRGWTSVTTATERVDTFARFRLRERPKTSRLCLIMSNTSPTKRALPRNSRWLPT